MKTYIFKTQLQFAKKIQREIEMPEDATLYNLASAVIHAYAFDFDRAFGFFSKISEGWNFDTGDQYELFADLK